MLISLGAPSAAFHHPSPLSQPPQITALAVPTKSAILENTTTILHKKNAGKKHETINIADKLPENSRNSFIEL